MDLTWDSGWLITLFGALLQQIPLYLVYSFGAVLALIRWKKHPRVSMYLLIAIIILFVTQIIYTAVQIWLPYYLATLSADYKSYAYYYYGLNVINCLIHALAFGLMLLAVFAGRPNPQLEAK